MARLPRRDRRPIHHSPLFRGLLIGSGVLILFCLLVLLLVPTAQERSLTYPGVLLYDSGRPASTCTVRIEGTYEFHFLGNDPSRFTGSVYLDDTPIYTDLDLDFDRGHGHLEGGVLGDELQWLVAELELLDSPCLLVCPAMDGAQALQQLPTLLSDCELAPDYDPYAP